MLFCAVLCSPQLRHRAREEEESSTSSLLRLVRQHESVFFAGTRSIDVLPKEAATIRVEGEEDEEDEGKGRDSTEEVGGSQRGVLGRQIGSDRQNGTPYPGEHQRPDRLVRARRGKSAIRGRAGETAARMVVFDCTGFLQTVVSGDR